MNIYMSMYDTPILMCLPALITQKHIKVIYFEWMRYYKRVKKDVVNEITVLQKIQYPSRERNKIITKTFERSTVNIV